MYHDEDDEVQFDTSSKWTQSKQKFTPVQGVVDRLLPGSYRVDSDYNGIYFEQQSLATDDLFTLENTVQQEVIESIKNFWTKEEIYAKMGYLWKRGILLEGPPGSGKTCIVSQLIEEIKEVDGIAIMVDSPQQASRGLQLLRRIEPRRPIIGILEELDELMAKYGESEFMSLLDGELQINNIVWVATTNHLEKLHNRVKNRPSRFDLVKHVGLPTRNDRARYLNHKIPTLKAEEIARWSMETEGFSIAHLKELVLSVTCLDATYEDTMGRLVEMIDNADETEDDNTPESTASDLNAATLPVGVVSYAPVTGTVAASVRAAGAAQGLMAS